MQVKKETQQLREFEEGLVSQYKFYLEDLEQTIKGTQPQQHTHTYTTHVSTEGIMSACPPSVCRLEAEEEEAQSGSGLPVVRRPGRSRRPLPV